MPKFQRFRRAYATGEGIPLVGIYVRGVFALNGTAYEAIGKPRHMILLYDADEKVIGLQPAEPTDPDAYKVRVHEGHTYQIAGASFLKHFEIPDEVRGRRYKAELTDGILAIKLQEPSDHNKDGRD